MFRRQASYLIIWLIMTVVAGCGDNSDNNVIGPDESDTTHKYLITQNAYRETEDLNQKITDEYGTDYRLADWNDLVADSLQVHQICETLDLKNGQELLVTWNNNKFWNDTNRHYFVSRHDHVKPFGYLSHSDIDDHYLDLGSWYDITMHALCIKKDSN